jgi:prepilin peptidase CpaA
MTASAIDLWSRRVPNWLSLPFLVSGLLVQGVTGGLSGLGHSLAGFGLALLLFGIPCLLRGMGMGDLKLAAGVGAWVGPEQLFMAFIMTGILGGIYAVLYAFCRGRLGSSLDSTADLLAHFGKFRMRPHEGIQLGAAEAVSIPYAPAIAAGALLSFFTK